MHFRSLKRLYKEKNLQHISINTNITIILYSTHSEYLKKILFSTIFIH